MRKADAKECFRTAWKLSCSAEFPFEAEVVFHPERRWRFDFGNRELLLAVEIDGIDYRSAGRHQRGKGFEEDCRKINAASALGWRVLRFTPAMINSDPVGCVELVLKVGELCSKGR